MSHASLSLLIVLVLIAGSVAPAAAEYPERALTIVAAYPAGGMVDIVARPMAESMKKKFPKGVAVLNRPGGGGSVGMAEVAQAKPDGYTVILAPVSTLVSPFRKWQLVANGKGDRVKKMWSGLD